MIEDILTGNPLCQKVNVGKNSLFQADCFDVFPFIKDKSIDIIFSDLPYNSTKCKWDTPIDLAKLWGLKKTWSGFRFL